MSYTSTDLSDEELWFQSQRCESAQEELIGRYTRMVRAISRPFFLAGADSEDLVQEGMIGLLTAIRQYDPEKTPSFAAFASLCIRRRVISAVRSATSQKHLLLTNAIPMCDALSQSQIREPGPEELLLSQERFNELSSSMTKSLSKLEQHVLSYYLDGYSYGQIADALKKTVKAVDNAVQRIRVKAARFQSANTGYTRSQ